MLLLSVVCAMATSLFGCRSARDNQIDILERELRSQEDYIYELEDYVVEYSDKLRGCRSCEPGGIVVERGTSEPDMAEAEPFEAPESRTVNQPTTDRTSEEPLPRPDPPKAKPLERDSPIPGDLEVPELEFEIEDPVGHQEVSQDQIELADAMFAEDDVEGQLVYIPDPAETEFEVIVDTSDETIDEPFIEDSELEEVAFEEEEDIQVYRQAERIVITEIFRSNGGEGAASTLLTIVEARDARNEPAELDGMVSLMVMSNDETSRQRLKRWDFSEEETIASWQSSQLGDGLHLELPLGKSSLPDEPIELWVRLMTNDGRKLLARLPFNQSTLAVLGEEPKPFDPEAAERALAEATPLKPFESQATDPLQVVAASEPKKSANQKMQWRASSQAARLATDSDSTSQSTLGWKSQSASRQSMAQVQRAVSTEQPTKKAVWTSGQ